MPQRALPLLVPLAILASAPATAGEYAPDATRIDWFVAVSDSHIGASGEQAAENLAWVTREGFQSIAPTMVVNCGDLTDATGGLPIPTGPQEDEWTQYRQILDDGGMTTATYLDLPGNHDQYADKNLPHYLKYSISGSADGQAQHSVRRDGPAGSVHLLATATPANNGGGVLQDDAALDAGERAFLQKALEDNADAAVRLVFGHHPVDRDIGNSIEEGKAEFKAMLESFDVDAYVYGHTHAFQSEYRGRTLHLNLDSLGKSDANHVAILALDAGTLSARTFAAADWPYVVVTAPADVNLGGGNPRAYSVPPGWKECPVRALVFGDKAPDGVRFQVDGGAWVPMVEAQPHVWAGTFDSTGLGATHHTLRVQASPWNRNDHEIAFRVGVTACSNGKDDDNDGYTDWPDDPGCPTPAVDDEAAHPVVGPGDIGPSDLPATSDDPVEALPESAGEDVPGPGDVGEPDAIATPDAPPAGDVPAADVPSIDRDAPVEVAADAAPEGAPASCVLGATTCEGDTVMRCADGRSFTAVESCADRGLACREGECRASGSGGCIAGEGVAASTSPVPWMLIVLGFLVFRRREVAR